MQRYDDMMIIIDILEEEPLVGMEEGGEKDADFQIFWFHSSVCLWLVGVLVGCHAPLVVSRVEVDQSNWERFQSEVKWGGEGEEQQVFQQDHFHFLSFVFCRFLCLLFWDLLSVLEEDSLESKVLA